MSNITVERSEDTVQLLRPPPRVFTDSVGHNVWMGDVEVIDLELVQTPGFDPYNTVDMYDPWPGI